MAQQGPQPPPREILPDDMVFAYEIVKGTGFPIPGNAPEVEKTYWEFDKKLHTTGNRDWDLVKMQCFNKSNDVGNKRRDILPLLSLKKVKKNKNQKLINRYRNELNGLKDQLVAKIKDFDQFVPNGFVMPKHFKEFPHLNEK